MAPLLEGALFLAVVVKRTVLFRFVKVVLVSKTLRIDKKSSMSRSSFVPCFFFIAMQVLGSGGVAGCEGLGSPAARGGTLRYLRYPTPGECGQEHTFFPAEVSCLSAWRWPSPLCPSD